MFDIVLICYVHAAVYESQVFAVLCMHAITTELEVCAVPAPLGKTTITALFIYFAVVAVVAPFALLGIAAVAAPIAVVAMGAVVAVDAVRAVLAIFAFDTISTVHK